MYKRFFGLNRNPFELSPDPSFMCPVGKSEEAIASIYHAILRRKGFVVLTGEVGTGKTLTVQYLGELWKDRHIPFANIIGPRLSVTDFLSYVTFDLGIKVAEPSKGNLLRALYEFLLVQFRKGLTTVLIVDEAHQLPRSVLEEIRLLTNFETAREKLLQILLVGQPELDDKLDSFEMRQMKQRIAIRCRLEPLCEDETRRYIERRLSVAGAGLQASTIFPVETARAIYRYSSGIPRLVSSICEQALIAAYAQQIAVIPVKIIDEVAIYFRLQSVGNLVVQTEHPANAAAEFDRQHRPAGSVRTGPALDRNIPSSEPKPVQSTLATDAESSLGSAGLQKHTQRWAPGTPPSNVSTIEADKQIAPAAVSNKNTAAIVPTSSLVIKGSTVPNTGLRAAPYTPAGSHSVVSSERSAKKPHETREETALSEQTRTAWAPTATSDGCSGPQTVKTKRSAR